MIARPRTSRDVRIAMAIAARPIRRTYAERIVEACAFVDRLVAERECIVLGLDVCPLADLIAIDARIVRAMDVVRDLVRLERERTRAHASHDADCLGVCCMARVA